MAEHGPYAPSNFVWVPPSTGDDCPGKDYGKDLLSSS
jgi:hypothetical protein